MTARLLALGLVVAAALAFGACAARADGDPASDYLIGQKVFLPFDAKIPKADERTLVATVEQAAAQGFPIRVAVISSDYNLGSVTVLWNKPQVYARFLGVELSYYYKQRLLIVMPSGFGFNHPKHDTARERALLAGIPIAATPAGLTRAATSAVTKLAAASGIRLSPPTPAPGAAPAPPRDGQNPIPIVAAVAVALLLGLLLRLLIRRRAAGRAGR